MHLISRSGVYETYWRFAAERQRIFFRRLEGVPRPYTDDPILQTYKFCNVYRACDRVSQFLIKSVIYDKQRSELDSLFRIFLFRLLNKPETWKILERKLGGEINLANFSFDRYAQILGSLRAEGPIYGNAFILCANKAFGYDEKHKNHLGLLEYVFQRSAHGAKLLASKSLAELFGRLQELPLIGDFMAYQLAIDFNYSEVFDFDENDFTIPGPGALRGIAKCFEDTTRVPGADVIKWMVDSQEKEFSRLNLDFQTLLGRPLHAIDCQGLFCETDKYCRVKFPGLSSNRVRIKAAFRPREDRINYYFPPKWGLNPTGTHG